MQPRDPGGTVLPEEAVSVAGGKHEPAVDRETDGSGPAIGERDLPFEGEIADRAKPFEVVPDDARFTGTSTPKRQRSMVQNPSTSAVRTVESNSCSLSSG
jgi:hypothetical protein